MPGYLRFRYFGKRTVGTRVGIIPADLAGEDIEQVLTSYLLADTSIASIVSTRVYPIVPPQTANLPDLVYQIIGGNGVHHLLGYSGISMARIRLTARSRRLRDCARLRECVRQLDGFAGMFGPVSVLFVRFEDVQDDYADPLPGSDVGTYERKFDLRIKYREAKPIN